MNHHAQSVSSLSSTPPPPSSSSGTAASTVDAVAATTATTSADTIPLQQHQQTPWLTSIRLTIQSAWESLQTSPLSLWFVDGEDIDGREHGRDSHSDDDDDGYYCYYYSTDAKNAAAPAVAAGHTGALDQEGTRARPEGRGGTTLEGGNDDADDAEERKEKVENGREDGTCFNAREDESEIGFGFHRQRGQRIDQASLSHHCHYKFEEDDEEEEKVEIKGLDEEEEQGESPEVSEAFAALLRRPYKKVESSSSFSSCATMSSSWELSKVEQRITSSTGTTKIRHCRQLETWDCGMACVQMTLRWLRDDNDEIGSTSYRGTGNEEDDLWGNSADLTERELLERKWMLQFINTESVWTIDLVILFERILHGKKVTVDDDDDTDRNNFLFSVPGSDASAVIPSLDENASVSYLFSSTNLGVDESYNGLFYYRQAFQRDEVRVTKRFRLAREMNIPTLCVDHLSLDRVVDMVSRENCVAIVLLDNRILIHDRGKVGHTGGIDRSNECKGIYHSCVADYDGMPSTTAAQSRSENSRASDLDGGNGHCVFTAAQTDNLSTIGTQSDSYAGHYVLLVGISTDPTHIALAEMRLRSSNSDNSENSSKHNHKGTRSSSSPAYCMVIKNPGSMNSIDFVTPDHFERAWRAKGTDEDIVFVVKHPACANVS